MQAGAKHSKRVDILPMHEKADLSQWADTKPIQKKKKHPMKKAIDTFHYHPLPKNFPSQPLP